MIRRYGIVAPPAIGHLNPMAALGLELRRRGHDVVVFTVADGARKLAGVALEVVTIGAASFGPGVVDQAYGELGRLSGRAGLRFSIDYFRREQAMWLAELPAAVKAAAMDVLLVDQVSPAGGAVAEWLGIPCVTIANALPINREPAVPPYFTLWQPSAAAWARWRNRLGNAFLDRLSAPLWRDLQEQRERWGLARHRCREEVHSPLLQLAQVPAAFDFPRERLAPHFHYVGRLADPSGQEPLFRDAVGFPWERLDGRPLVYASLGTLQNGHPSLFAQIAEACAPLPAQLVISLGNPSHSLPPLAGDPVVVPYAPHQKLIERAALVITHAGLNTTLTALGAGVPVLAIPITNEQPGIAARVAYSGAGQVLPLKHLQVETLRAMVKHLLSDPRYRANAQRLRDAFQVDGGVGAAADWMETLAVSPQRSCPAG